MSLLHTLKFIVNHPLNSHRKMAAFLGFFKWQVGSRLVPGKVIYEWVNDTRFLAFPGEQGLTGNIYCGLDEFADMAYVLHAMSEKDTFVDIGANVGSYTILACGAKGARGCCFEPVPSTYERLLSNLRLNQLLDRVHAFNVGLSDREGYLNFTSGENTTNHIVAQGEKTDATLQVKVVSLDVALDGVSPTMMKIDVEGFETAVIRGGGSVLQNPALHSVIMELNGSGSRYGYSEEGIVATMQEYGFSTFTYDPFLRRLISLQGRPSSGGNTLFVRGAEAVERIVAGAPKIGVGSVMI